MYDSNTYTQHAQHKLSQQLFGWYPHPKNWNVLDLIVSAFTYKTHPTHPSNTYATQPRQTLQYEIVWQVATTR